MLISIMLPMIHKEGGVFFMKSIEDEANKVTSVLSTDYLNNLRIKNASFIKENIHKAIVVNRASALQHMIKKILLKNPKQPSKKKFSAVNQLPEGYEKTSITKEIENAKKCHRNLSFRLTYLEQLLLEDQINLRQFKQLKGVFIKQQLQYISELSKKTSLKKFSAQTLKKKPSKAIDYHINPYQR
jgi:hypothetical protein